MRFATYICGMINEYKTIREYAILKAISTQSVYRQLKRDRNKEEKFQKLEVKKLEKSTLVKEK